MLTYWLDTETEVQFWHLLPAATKFSLKGYYFHCTWRKKCTKLTKILDNIYQENHKAESLFHKFTYYHNRQELHLFLAVSLAKHWYFLVWGWLWLKCRYRCKLTKKNSLYIKNQLNQFLPAPSISSSSSLWNQLDPEFILIRSNFRRSVWYPCFTLTHTIGYSISGVIIISKTAKGDGSGHSQCWKK